MLFAGAIESITDGFTNIELQGLDVHWKPLSLGRYLMSLLSVSRTYLH